MVMINHGSPTAQAERRKKDENTMSKRMRLEDATAQMASLATSIYGTGFDHFKQMLETDQDNLLWLLADLADEIRELVQET